MDRFQNKYRIPSSRLQNWDYGWAGAYFITICTKGRENYFGNITDGEMQLSGAGILADVFWHEIKNHAKNVELGAFVVMPNHIHGILILNGENGNRTNNCNDIGNIDGNIVIVDGNVFNNVDGMVGGNVFNNVDDMVGGNVFYNVDGMVGGNVFNNVDGMVGGNVFNNVETGHALSLQPQPQPQQKLQPSPQPQPQTEKTIGQQRFQNIGKNTVSSIIGSYKSAVTKHAKRLGFALKWQERFYDHIIRNDSEYQRITGYIITNPRKWDEDKFFNVQTLHATSLKND